MIKYTLKLLLLATIFLIYDKLFIILTNHSADIEIDKRLEYLVNGQMNKDIIITGSSTGSRDIIASQIEDETGLSTYNLCYPGSDVEFHEFILKTLVKFNEPPKVVLLIVDDNTELLCNEAIIFRKDRLYPLVKYQYIWKELANRDGTDKFFPRFLVLQRLNKYNFDLGEKRFTPLDTIMDCGSMPISWKKEGTHMDYISCEMKYPVDEELPEKLTSFREIIQMCDSYNIKLVIVFPPIFKAYSKSFENRIRQLSSNEVIFYRYNTQNPIYQSAEYYSDETHLIRKGAVVFTYELVLFLNELVKDLPAIEIR